MTLENFDSENLHIETLIGSHSLRLALDCMRGLAAKDAGMSSFMPEIDALEQKYYYMLRFLCGPQAFEGVNEELHSVEEAMLELMERMHRHYHTLYDPGQYYARLRFQSCRPEETLESLYADYIEESKRLAEDPRLFTDTGVKASLERIASDIFMHIWTLPNLTEDHAATINAMLADSDIPAYDRELWLHAIGLSDNGDPQRHDILRQYCGSKDVRMWAAAVMWLFVALIRTNGTPGHNDDDIEAFCIPMKKSAAEQFLEVASAFMRTVVREFSAENERMMRDISDMSRNMARRWEKDKPSDMGSVLSDIPEGYFDKVRNFNEAQQRGEDVFASTIGRLRGFPFFRNIPEWFLPFHMDRSDLAPIVDGEGAGTASIMEKMPNLCDSDKYALLLSLTNAPENMRSTMMANAYESFIGLADTEEGQDMMRSLDKAPTRQMALGNALRGLARFMHNNSAASEVNIPTKPRTVVNTVLNLLQNNFPENIYDFAATLGDCGFHTEATKCYTTIIDSVLGDMEPEKVKGMAIADDIYDLFTKGAHEARLAGHNVEAMSLLSHALRAGDQRYETTAELVDLAIDEYDSTVDAEIFGSHLEDMLEPFEQSHGSEAGFLRLLGRAATISGNHHRAAEAYYNLNYILPADDHSAKGPLARALCRSAQYDEAAQVLEDIPGIDKNLSLTALLAIALWLRGARDGAVQALMAALPAAGGRLEALSKELDKEIANIFEEADDTTHQDAASVRLLAEILSYKAYGSRFGNLS